MSQKMIFPSFSSLVIHGKHLGRTIGFPTANVKLDSSCTVLSDGTYGLKVFVDGKSYYGIGVYLRSQELFEAHLFDFSQDIYGEIITVTPLFLIRENQKFSGIEALKSQIEKDREVMQNWISKNNEGE
ncbi:MAG: hypothetical protein HHAS10_06100 [Candidatus Altimarinota bacterium]